MPNVFRITFCLIIMVLIILLHLVYFSGKPLKDNVHQVLFSQSKPYIDNGLKRAAVSYAAARGLNAIISMVQESEIQAAVFGAGASIALGQVLDPVNDLIERFSWVMFLSLASFGVQKIALEFLLWTGLNIFLSASLFLILAGLIARGKGLLQVGLKIFLLSLIIILFIPLFSLISEKTYDFFLKPVYQDSVQEISKYRHKLQPGVLKDKNDFWSKLKDFDLSKQIEQLKEKTEQIIQYLMDILVVFIIQTIVLPLAFLAIFVWSIKAVVNRSLPFGLDNKIMDRLKTAA